MPYLLKNSRPYSSGYDKDGRYYEQWIDDDDDYDFHDEESLYPDDDNALPPTRQVTIK